MAEGIRMRPNPPRGSSIPPIADSGTKSNQNEEVSGRMIVVGWLIAHRFAHEDAAAVAQARVLMLDILQQQFGEFVWHIPVVQRFESLQSTIEEPVTLLDEGVQERDIQRWDYVFVMTQANLRSYYKPYALGAPSRAVSVAVLSTARLVPPQFPTTTEYQERAVVLARRICTLGLHLLGDLNGLAHADDPQTYMYPPEASEDLDRMMHYAPREHDQLRQEFSDVADLRLEELPEVVRGGVGRFYLRAIWIGADDIASAVLQAEPWQFPLRLSRLTTAAISTLLILLVTAESWDLGMSQPPLFVLQFSLVALLGTSGFILKRQRVLLRRGRHRLTEQTVVTNVAMSVVVFLGMLTTYLLLFFLTLLLSYLLFSHTLVAGWAVSLQGKIAPYHYLVFSAFVASLGIVIGALAASFELPSYFRHIAYVDEET